MEKDLVERLRSITGVGLMDCKRALIDCDGDIGRAAKYLKHYPMSPPMDFWESRSYRYCSQCDRYYVVTHNTVICDICENVLEHPN